ncbi:cation/H(+) antiporter 15-like [Humulus lupulus]|uniref:cation/H(+) antiporter 15-like n=1 Tax=Humulus lupulus TaxID=3486 RepID=UPI002B407096|nr:cation/H(+) antiporter 15-like [Humulus lupulus]
MVVMVNDSIVLCNSSTLDQDMDWCLRSKELNYVVACFKQKLIPQSNGIWLADSGTNVTFKTFLIQLALIICVNRLLISFFRLLRLPHIAAEILGGVLMGASGIARTPIGFGLLYPQRGTMILETVAHLGLVFYMFMVGLEIDIKPILKTPKKALIVAASGFLLPFPVGCALHYMFIGNAEDFGPVAAKYGPIFWGIALSTTNFPDLAQILEDTKLLHSEIARTALSAAAVTDVFTWVILIVIGSIVKGVHVYTLIFGSFFVVFSLAALRPTLNWLLRRRRRHGEYYYYYDDDCQICFVVTGALLYGYITDSLGLHSIIGAFLFGLIMPKQGELRRVLMERVEDFVSGMMMPLFFLIVGLRTNRQDVFEGQFGMSTIVGVIVLAFGVKIVSTFMAAVLFNKMSPRDGLALGFLMNTKGMLSLIVVTSARNVKVLNNQTYTMIIIALWWMTMAVCPILTLTYKKSLKQSTKRMQRSLTSLQPSSELRVLTCFHSSYEVTGIINLLDASNPTRDSPISVFVIQLIENIGRTTAINIVHGACKTINMSGGDYDKDHKHFDSSPSSSSSQHAAFAAFNGFKNGKEGIFIQPLTAVSARATMHEHICDFAEENHTNMVILPFHLKTITNVGKISSSSSRSGGGTNLSKTNLDFRNINKKVMAKSSCSVAILVDRGRRPPMAASVQAGHNFMVLFVGGPDDREALAYVERMSGSRNVALTVMRFVAAAADNDEDNFIFDYKEEKDKLLDEQYFEEFRHKMYENPLVNFTQAVVSNVEDVVRAIGTIEKEYDLIIVGKGRGGRGSLSKMLEETETEWSDYPELGLLGDTLVCSNFASNAWILVVQQGSGCDIRLKDEQLSNCGKLSEQCGHMTWQPSLNETPELALFVSRNS